MKALFKRTAPPPVVAEEPKKVAKELQSVDPDPPWEAGGYNTTPARGMREMFTTLDKKWIGTRGCIVRLDRLSAKGRQAHIALPIAQDIEPHTITALESQFAKKGRVEVLHRIPDLVLNLRPDAGGEDDMLPDEQLYVYTTNKTDATVVMVNSLFDPPERILSQGEDQDNRVASEKKDYFAAPFIVPDPTVRKVFCDLIRQKKFKEAETCFNKYITS